MNTVRADDRFNGAFVAFERLSQATESSGSLGEYTLAGLLN